MPFAWADWSDKIRQNLESPPQNLFTQSTLFRSQWSPEEDTNTSCHWFPVLTKQPWGWQQISWLLPRSACGVGLNTGLKLKTVAKVELTEKNTMSLLSTILWPGRLQSGYHRVSSPSTRYEDCEGCSCVFKKGTILLRVSRWGLYVVPFHFLRWWLKLSKANRFTFPTQNWQSIVKICQICQNTLPQGSWARWNETFAEGRHDLIVFQGLYSDIAWSCCSQKMSKVFGNIVAVSRISNEYPTSPSEQAALIRHHKAQAFFWQVSKRTRLSCPGST